MSDFSPVSADFRSGFACLVGRPNAGKSTLTNAMVGHKVAITSNRPQTTRHTIRGVVHRPYAQIVVVDTPGLHKPKTLLGERLNDLVASTLAEVDVIGFCLPANQPVGPGDRFIAQQLIPVMEHRLRTHVIAIVTKTDTVSKQTVAEHLLAVSELGNWHDIVPVSATKDDNVSHLIELMISRLPQGPPLYPDGEITDEPEMVMVGELIREAALEGVRDELPHSLAVVIEEMVPRENRTDGLLDVFANVYVERSSQKGIVIGKGGARLKDVGMKARQGIEALLGTPVNLQIHVKVAPDWQRDPRQLRRLGF